MVGGNKDLLSMASQIVGVLAASATGKVDADNLKTGAWVADNATTYNFDLHMPPGLTEYGQAATSMAEYMQQHGATAEEIAQAQLALNQGQGFEGPQPANEFVKAWGAFMAGELTGLGLAALIGKAGSWFTKVEQGLPTNSVPVVADTVEHVPVDLGKVTFYAANDVGSIYAPKVSMIGTNVIFDDLAIGTSKGFMGYGPDGAAELVGPLKKLLEYTQSKGGQSVTFRGYFASEEGAALGGGQVGERFSYSFPATKEGLREFLKGLQK
jgi:filamentous hemagglutinin